MHSRSYLPTAVLLCVYANLSPSFAQDAPALFPDHKGVIFQIGEEDKYAMEFKHSWRGIDEFECTVGIDCDAALFPARLSAKDAAEFYDSSSVQRARIVFNLDQEYPNMMLVVARFGIETTVVRFDNNAPIAVTHEMMDPPSAKGVWGRFELPLGVVSAGMHQIELSILNNQVGIGRHRLDAIKLVAIESES